MTVETVRKDTAVPTNGMNNHELRKKLESPISELYLRSVEIAALVEQNITYIKDFYLREYTCNKLDKDCKMKISEKVNVSLKLFRLPLLTEKNPTDKIYAIFMDTCRKDLQGVHQEALNIMRMYWGEISKKEIVDKLSDPENGTIMSDKDIKLIIEISLLLLKIKLHRRINQADINVIIDKYPILRVDVHDIGLKPLEASALEGMGVPRVYCLYKEEMTCDDLDKGRDYELSKIVNKILKNVGLHALAKSGSKPVGPLYALYRATKRQQIYGKLN